MRRKNLKILIPIIFLSILSLINIYGASFMSSMYSKAFSKQLIWIIIGFILMFITSKINIKFIIKYIDYLYIIGIFFLILVLFYGKTINGASSWFKLGPISFQPSELFKVIYLIFISKVIAKKKSLLKVIAYTFIPSLLIFLEPDTGVVVMYIIMMIGMILYSDINKKKLFIPGISFVIIGSVFVSIYIFNSDLFIKIFGTSFFYRMDRLVTFKNNTSYQLSNALIGIGSSGFFGHGIKSYKLYIPEAITDFAFDLSICNMGLLVGIIIVLTYVYLLINVYNIGIKKEKIFNRVMILGIFSILLFQTFEHILMNIGITPITGITLPFLSYGGSSLISYFIMFGLVIKNNH